MLAIPTPFTSRAFSAAGILVKKEPAGLVQSDGKHTDSFTVTPWCGGRPLAWDVTVCTTVAASYLTAASHTAGVVVDRKCSKYTELSSSHEFQPVAIESHGPLSDTHGFLSGRTGPKNHRPFRKTS